LRIKGATVLLHIGDSGIDVVDPEWLRRHSGSWPNAKGRFTQPMTISELCYLRNEKDVRSVSLDRISRPARPAVISYYAWSVGRWLSSTSSNSESEDCESLPSLPRRKRAERSERRAGNRQRETFTLFGG